MQVTTLSTQLGLGSELVDWYRDAMDDEHTKSLYSPSAPIFFPQVQKFFLQSCAKDFIQLLLMHNKSAQRKRAKHKKTSRGKISKRVLIFLSEKYNLEPKNRHSEFRKRLTAH